MKKYMLSTLSLLVSLMILMSSITFAGPTPIGKDKYAHASVSGVIEYGMNVNKPFCNWTPLERALFNVTVIGGGKEWYDHNHPNAHSADWNDIAADAVGAFGTEGCIWLIHKRF